MYHCRLQASLSGTPLLNSAITGYITEGALLTSSHLSIHIYQLALRSHCERFTRCVPQLLASLSGTFPPNSAVIGFKPPQLVSISTITGYATEGALFTSSRLSTDLYQHALRSDCETRLQVLPGGKLAEVYTVCSTAPSLALRHPSSKLCHNWLRR